VLQVLGYAQSQYGDQARTIDYSDLKTRSDKITHLLHQAQGAFAKLHRYLES